jgi:hypothetical protein
MLDAITEILNNKPKNSVTIHLRKIKGINLYIENSIYRTMNEMIYCIRNDINEIPICEYHQCNEYKKFDKVTKYSRGCNKYHSTIITSQEKYGVDNPSQSMEIKDKIKNVLEEKYGDHHMKKKEYKELFSALSKETSEIRTQKTKKTCLEKYGVDSFSKTQEYKDKVRSTNIDNYGYEHNFQNGTASREKRKNTMLKKYGVEFALQNEDIKEKSILKFKTNHIKNRLKIISGNGYKPLFEIDEYTGNQEEYKWLCNSCNNVFTFVIEDGKIPRCKKCFPISRSSYEKELVDVFSNTNISVEQNIRRYKYNDKIVEFDLFLNNKLLIEMNGNYWHSESNGKDKHYHLNKTKLAIDNGFNLLHIFEDEWVYKKNIVKSIINSKLGNFETRLFARKCQIKEITSKEKNQFLEKNHLQGVDKSSIKIGLFYDDVLVSIMTFGKSRYNKKYQWEMHRFCNKVDYQIVGGASRLWTYFIKKYTPESVITYADKRYSDGTFYEKIGFKKIRESAPNFFVLGKNKLQRQSRLNWQKHQLSSKLEKFDSSMTAWENLQMNGYDRIWDCGNYVFEWTISKGM